MMPKILPNVASGLLKACRPMKMGEMEKGDRPPGWQSIISINSFIELIASGSECSRNEASAGSPHFFPPFFYTFFLFVIVLIFLDFLFCFFQYPFFWISVSFLFLFSWFSVQLLQRVINLTVPALCLFGFAIIYV